MKIDVWFERRDGNPGRDIPGESFSNTDDLLARIAKYQSSLLHSTHLMRIGGDPLALSDLFRVQAAGIEDASALIKPKDGPRTE